jgi:type IV secretion system protein VirB10
MDDDFKDPYEAGNEAQAKILTAEPPARNRRLVIVAVVAASLILGVVILANVAAMASKPGVDASTVVKPVTMSKAQGDRFAQEQAGHAAFLKEKDEDAKLRKNEDTVLGRGAGLAGDTSNVGANDPCIEVQGVSPMTTAQRQAAGCDGATPGGAQMKPKSEAQIRFEKQRLVAENRRQNDIDSSPVALDFSDYFEKKETPATAQPVTAQSVANSADAAPGMEMIPAEARAQTERVLAEHARRREGVELAHGEEETASASNYKEPHDPKEDYVFDSSYGKLHRIMEDTIIETVLVNRLAGASPGPVICMVREDVYSHSGAHLLIPKGTRLLGKVSAVASLNQERLFVAFHRMIMPDGYSVSLDKFQGLDVIGQAGLRDLVNRHYVQIFGASIALAAVGAVTQIGNSGAAYGAYDFGVSMRNGASEQLGQSSQRIMERFLNVLPTFTIRERALVKVMLSGDLLVPDTKNHKMDPDL